ncbi:MAG: hypothetical protein QM777_25430 [Pseudorhodoferax sp.]
MIAILLGLSILFFYLAHSLLLFFKEQEVIEMPLREAIFPKPKNGRFVAALCAAMGFLFLLAIPTLLGAPKINVHWKFVFVLYAGPIICYGYHFFSRTQRRDGKYIFISQPNNQKEFLAALAVAMIVVWIL